MFTGLVEGKARIVALDREGSGIRMGVAMSLLSDDVKLGDSICVSGCCLTVVRKEEQNCWFELGAETLSKTRFASMSVDQEVNMERSLKVGDRMGGHFVTGHVDGLGTVSHRGNDGPWSTFRFTAPRDLLVQMVPKGSITVDGVSLTIVDVSDSEFSVALIPHTLDVTTLGMLQVHDQVHLETDILAKYAQRVFP